MKIQNRTLQKIAKSVLLSMCFLTLGVATLPAVVGLDWSEHVRDAMVFRSYNFTEVSDCGWLASAFLATAIVLLLAQIPFHIQCIGTAILGVFGGGCYIGGLSAVITYLCNDVNMHMELQYGCAFMMIFYFLIIVFAVLFSNIPAQQPQKVVVRFHKKNILNNEENLL